MRLSVIIPAYNEEERLPKTLEAIDAYLNKQSYDYEILVVNDGSKDNTFEVAKSLCPKIKGLRPIGYNVNQGKGYAVRFGMLEAKGDYRLFSDADNSTSIDQVEKMWPEFEKGFDVVVGSRDVKGAVLDPPQPFHRRLLGDCFRIYTQIVCGTWEVKDSQCGFKGISRKAAESIFPKCLINRFAFDPEMLVLAKKQGFKIKEIPVHWKNDSASKVGFKSILKMAKDVLRIRWFIILGKYS